jgi:cytochrome oxidase Cu insertion factor (SCO1/SenC/PrrC family)
MKLIRKNSLFTSLILFLLLAGTYACTKNDTGISTDKGASNNSSGAVGSVGSGIADLLASMDMYYFAEPVQAPDFELLSLEGRKTSLSQYRGQVVLLTFWATW